VDAILGGAVGGLLGVVATALGVVLTRYLSHRSAEERRRHDLLAVVRMVVLEMESQRDCLQADKPLVLLSNAAFEVMRTSYFLAQLPTETASQTLNIYNLFRRINDKMEHHRQGVIANMGTDDAKKMNVESIRTDIDLLRLEADSAVEKCLPLLKKLTKERA